MNTSFLNNTEDLIHRFLKDPSDKNMIALVDYAKNNLMSDIEMISLAKGMARSGSVLHFDFPIYDIPSTGGPSSLSTLLCPLILNILGNYVLKLGVSGRPAGGIDILAQLKGYNFSPSVQQIKEWLKGNKYVHFLANKTFAPLDAILFKFRKEHSAIDTVSLVIASLLSKKISVGVTNVGLDVRVSEYGNFGATIAQAKSYSKLFNQIAKATGIQSTCFITDLSFPQQPFIGRGEALLALHYIFNGQATGNLLSHLSNCINMAVHISSNKNLDLRISDIQDAFYKNLCIQGSSKQSFEDYVSLIAKEHKYVIRSPKSGYLKVNLYRLRDAIVAIQNQVNGIEFPDPCGVILKRTSNEFVFKDEILCTFRCNKPYEYLFRSYLESSLELSSKLSFATTFEVIG